MKFCSSCSSSPLQFAVFTSYLNIYIYECTGVNSMSSFIIIIIIIYRRNLYWIRTDGNVMNLKMQPYKIFTQHFKSGNKTDFHIHQSLNIWNVCLLKNNHHLKADSFSKCEINEQIQNQILQIVFFFETNNDWKRIAMCVIL